MSISSIASSIWSNATTALTTPTSTTAGVSSASSTTTGTTAATTSGASDPFAQLTADLQSWLTQLQAGNTSATQPDPTQSTASTTASTDPTASTQEHHHHHHHDAGETQTDGTQLNEDANKLLAYLNQLQSQAGGTATASPSTNALTQALNSYTTSGNLAGS